MTGGDTTRDDTKIGGVMPDGTKYAGISPDSGKPFYALPADAPLTMKWQQAMKYAAKLDANGHKDWRVPTKAELSVLFQNKATIGEFDEGSESGLYSAGKYWSSSQMYFSGGAWSQDFRDGWPSFERKCDYASLRCVRE